MPLVAKLMMPFQVRNPGVRVTVRGRTSGAILELLHHREIDAGITYITNEPIGEVSAVPLYREEFVFLTTADGPFGNKDNVTWEEAGSVPLCLFERDLQNRRIIDSVLRRIGAEPVPMMESDSILALVSYVRLGQMASIVPNSALEGTDLNGTLRALPIVQPHVSHTIGLIVSDRFPLQPAAAALIEDARSFGTPQLIPAA